MSCIHIIIYLRFGGIFFFYWALVASAPGSIAACRLIVQARLQKFPLLLPGAPTSSMTWETSSRERGNYGWEMSGEFCHQIASFTLFEGIFNVLQICDMGLAALLPLQRKACWGSFRHEKSDGFGRVRTCEPETSTLTHRPLKPLGGILVYTVEMEVIGPFEMLSVSLRDSMAWHSSMPWFSYSPLWEHIQYFRILFTWIVVLHRWVSCLLHFRGICFVHLQVVVVVYPY
jgi:hypothetical protein